MIRPGDKPEAARLLAAISAYETAHAPLLGLAGTGRKESLIAQIIESQRRNRYIQLLNEKADLSAKSADPHCSAFDPHKAIILNRRWGNHDEACWLAFLSIHFGKHLRGEWQYVAQIYGKRGSGRWEWNSVRADVTGFRDWLEENAAEIREARPRSGFGNHRKYESLNAWSPTGTGEVVATYIAWVSKAGDHKDRLYVQPGTSRTDAFDQLYRSMRVVRRFGRVARFDYLTLLSKLELADVEAGHPYLVDATGPLTGARLLLDGVGSSSSTPRELHARLAVLNNFLKLPYDVIEDSLCNWQKSPARFKRFRG